MGVTKKATTVAKIATKKRGRPVGSKNSIPFPVPRKKEQDLIDELQKALAIEMKTVEGMEKLFEEFKSVSKKISDLTFWERVKLVFTGKY
jgi:hypothetical protein